eukprot:PhM_4_TR5009/c0_g4_i1/m.2848
MSLQDTATLLRSVVKSLEVRNRELSALKTENEELKQEVRRWKALARQQSHAQQTTPTLTCSARSATVPPLALASFVSDDDNTVHEEDQHNTSSNSHSHRSASATTDLSELQKRLQEAKLARDRVLGKMARRTMAHSVTSALTPPPTVSSRSDADTGA